MKEGIHLGPPLSKRPLPASAALLVLAAAALGLAALYYLAQRDVGVLREEVARLESSLDSSSTATSGEAEAAARRLGALLGSGILDAMAPTAVLSLTASALPEGMILQTLTFKPSPPSPSLTLDALADGALEVTELQRRMSRSSLVQGTTLLEERRLPDGSLSVRMQVDLRAPGTSRP